MNRVGKDGDVGLGECGASTTECCDDSECSSSGGFCEAHGARKASLAAGGGGASGVASGCGCTMLVRCLVRTFHALCVLCMHSLLRMLFIFLMLRIRHLMYEFRRCEFAVCCALRLAARQGSLHSLLEHRIVVAHGLPFLFPNISIDFSRHVRRYSFRVEDIRRSQVPTPRNLQFSYLFQ